ncbi:MAG: O-antigen ligase family protein [Ignavibacteria bacterium]|nr:O-antigen ligase family protein [Ignavibacteria bacterium]MCU7519303.1 O-antigen ligase family protein [Ignavibacteria bacterium]
MQIQLENNAGDVSLKNNKLLFSLALVLVLPTIGIFSLFGTNYLNIILVCASPIVVILAFNLSLAYSFFIISLFTFIYISYASLGEVFSVFVIIAFLISYKFEWEVLKNPLHKAFFVFIALILPSFINSFMLVTPVFVSLRLVLFLFIFTLTPVFITSYKQIEKYLSIFLFFSVLNGLHIIYLAFATGMRVFGFAGLMYVDYVGIALVISLMRLIYGEKRLLYSFTTLVLLIALIYTQTRNSWISSGLSILLIVIQYVRKGSGLGFKKRNIILAVSFAAIMLVVTFFVANSINSNAFARLSNSGPKTSEEIADNLQKIGSVASRVFIWKTAWNAFMAHPFVGIGLYSFPIASEKYYTIDPFIYELFVHFRSPHLTLLAVLTESGIIGMIGFFIFMTTIVRYFRSNISKSRTYEEIFYSNTMWWLIVYIIISMLMTDAWLWGQLMMLWSIILGFSLANGRILECNHRLSSAEMT